MSLRDFGTYGNLHIPELVSDLLRWARDILPCLLHPLVSLLLSNETRKCLLGCCRGGSDDDEYDYNEQVAMNPVAASAPPGFTETFGRRHSTELTAAVDRRSRVPTGVFPPPM